MANTPIITSLVMVAFTLTATPTLAFGPGAGGHGPKMNFQELDSNGDGQITQEEMDARATTRFSEADANGDGTLSKAELEAQGQKRMSDRISGMIARFDKDGDGALSQDEMPGPRRAGRMFDHFDSDASGGISEQEFSEAREKMRSHKKGGWGKHGDKN